MLRIARLMRRDEEGSLIVALGVMMILTFLSVAILARSLGTLRSVRRTQDFSGGLAVAGAGLSDAVYQIEQGRTGTFPGSGSAGSGTYDFTAAPVDANRWDVRSQGVSNGVKHAVEATVTRDVAYPYALFTEQSLILNGGYGSGIWTYDDNNPGNPWNNWNSAVVGSNHAITATSGSAGAQQHYYSPNGSCTGCSNGQQKRGPRPLPAPTAPTTWQACPANGVFSGAVNGANGLTFLCDRDIVFTGNVSVLNPPVKIFVSADHSVSMVGATVNDFRNNGSGGRGKDFQLLKAGTGPLTVGGGEDNGGSVAGVIYSPQTDLRVNSGQNNGFFFEGSLTLNRLVFDGSPNFTMLYDTSIGTIRTDTWAVSEWREVPSG